MGQAEVFQIVLQVRCGGGPSSHRLQPCDTGRQPRDGLGHIRAQGKYGHRETLHTCGQSDLRVRAVTHCSHSV